VVLTANLTSDPSISTSLTLGIVPLPIQIAFTTLPASMIAASGTSSMVATVTNDPTQAGVNWTLSCGSSDCGSLQSHLPIPTQTASGQPIVYTAPASVPMNGTVTITATSVADPTQSKSATITVESLSIVVTPVTSSVPIGTTLSLVANVAYDAQNAGVDWGIPTCAIGADCGTLSSSHTASGSQNVYTPPATIPQGGTVMFTVASTANPSVKAVVQLTITPPPPIEVSVAPPTAAAQVSGPAKLIATVLYDPANLGVDWTLTCGSPGACGSVTSHTASGSAATFIAPPSVPVGSTVTATATSTADPTKNAASTITIEPSISIAFVLPVPSSVTAGTATSFTANVTNDVAAAGVDWSASCANAPCGTFNQSGHTASGSAVLFTAPVTAPAGTITITATSTASSSILPTRSVSTTVTVIPVITINFVPFAPSQIQGSDSTTTYPAPVGLTADVVNDTTNAGVDWSVCGSYSTCGEFQITPAIAATSTKGPINPTYSATAHTASGQAVAYVPPPSPASNTTGLSVTITAKSHNPLAPLATVSATPAIVANPLGPALQGVVMAGLQPVSGSSITLYAAGTSGYAAASSPITISGTATTVLTAANGAFNIPAGYSCPSQTSLMYIVAVGGNAGAGTNANLAMMTALGPCGGLSSSSTITVNEVTTIGSVWALAPFMSDYEHVGSSSANATNGLSNAFTTVNNLVSILTGLPNQFTPSGNGTVPRNEINTIADILNSCTVTAGGAVGDGSACGALFQATTIANGSPSPNNTILAALNMAQAPYFNTGTVPGSIYNLLPAIKPFAPAMTTAPNDWTIALNFAGGGLGNQSYASGLAVDASGDIWITNNNYGSVTELNSAGAALSPFGTFTGGYQGGGLSNPAGIAIDTLGNAWIANDGTLSEFSPLGIAVSPSSGYTGGGLTGFLDGLAIDGAGNVWAASGGFPGSVAWFAGPNATIGGVATAPGTALSPATGYTQAISEPTGAIAVDTAGTVWVLNAGDNSATELNSTNGNFIQQDFGYQQLLPSPSASVLSQGVSNAIAIDNAGNVFESPGNQLVELLAGGSIANAGGLGYASNSTQFAYSPFLALDGSEHIWLLIVGGAGSCGQGAVVVELSSTGAVLNNNPDGCGYLGGSINTGSAGIAVDGSGGLWVLNTGSVTEFVGLATPVVTPFAIGVANKTLGKKP
jgi:hypothetical protein